MSVTARWLPLIPVVTLALGVSTLATADTFRCGTSLVSAGMPSAEVRAKCGAPTSLRTVIEDVRIRTAAGGFVKTGETVVQYWRYDRGASQFAATLTVRDGSIKDIRFEK